MELRLDGCQNLGLVSIIDDIVKTKLAVVLFRIASTRTKALSSVTAPSANICVGVAVEARNLRAQMRQELFQLGAQQEAIVSGS